MKKFKIIIFAALFLFTVACSDDDNEITDSDNNTETNAVDTSTPSVNNYVLIATGQTKTYDEDGLEVTVSEGDALYGQDGHYKKGEEMEYQDNGDGTVTDLKTGLMWQQDPPTDSYTWSEAKTYCENLELDGYDDWRMPSCKELYSISNFESGWPYLNTTYFYLATNTKDEQFWTSNYYVGVTVEGGDNAAFGVNHVTGHIKAYAAESGGPVGGNKIRAVRGDDYGINEYIDNGDSTITDSSTGLMWAKYDSKNTLDWPNALVYAENSNLSGNSDWRLPNVKELQSIVDYTKSPSATDADAVGPAIDDLFYCTPIVNEGGDDDYGYYWTSTSAHFNASGDFYYAWYVAFGMAVDGNGDDFHGAGAVRFDTKIEDGPDGEGGERYYNFVRLVRDAE